MIRGVVTVFGVVVIGLMVVGAIYVGSRFADWFARRREIRRVTRAQHSMRRE